MAGEPEPGDRQGTRAAPTLARLLVVQTPHAAGVLARNASSPAPPESILSRGRQVRDAKWPRPLIFYSASGLQGDANGSLKTRVRRGDAGSCLPHNFRGERNGVS